MRHPEHGRRHCSLEGHAADDQRSGQHDESALSQAAVGIAQARAATSRLLVGYGSRKDHPSAPVNRDGRISASSRTLSRLCPAGDGPWLDVGRVQKRCILRILIDTQSMSRPLRLEFCGHSYRVSSRGDRREAIYEDDEDRERFLEIRARVTISSSATRRSWSMPMPFCSSAFAISRSIRPAPGCVPIRVSGRGAATGRCWGRSRIRGGWRSAACFAARQASLDGGAVLRAFRHRRAGPAVDLDAVESSGAPRRGCLRQANPGCAAGAGEVVNIPRVQRRPPVPPLTGFVGRGCACGQCRQENRSLFQCNDCGPDPCCYQWAISRLKGSSQRTQ